MNDKIFIVTNENFTDFITRSPFVVVDFWAGWCGPCKMLLPVIDELANEYQDTEVTIAKCNVDECIDIATDLGIMSIPAIYIFKNGKIVEKVVGFRQKAQLKTLIERHRN